MKFHLQGHIELNRDIAEASDDLRDLMESAEKTFLAKGAPEGLGPRITEYRLGQKDVVLKIESGTHVRAHDALTRIKRNIGVALGKKHKLGARSATIDEYRIEMELDREPKERFSIPFVDSIEFEGVTCTLVLKNLNEEFIEDNYVDRILSLVKKKVDDQFYEGKGEYWELMWSSEEIEPVWTKDPTEEMAKRKWIRQGPTKGKWFYKPEVTAIFRAMEKIAIDEIMEPLGFQEVIESHHVPFDIWVKTGHMTGSPNELYYVCEPKTRDPEAWERFRDLVYITREVDNEELAGLVAQPTAGICYAQCPVMYWGLSNTTIATESLPVKIYDRSANSNRYESGGRHGIERVDEFHRIEPVYLGTPEQLHELREQMIERYKYVFNDILELEWRMVWVTPWYMQQSGQISHDNIDKQKEKGTIDFEAYMPYRGSRKDSEWLEFQNLSIIGDKYTNAFGIKPQKGELWSGCSGIGLERWTAAFLAQKSLDYDNWPKKFQEAVGKLPEGIKLL